MKYANTVVGDNQCIVDYVKKTYGRDAALIEYGGDHACQASDGAVFQQYGLTPGTYAFKVARIEPENNIEMIVEAFSHVPDQRLVVVGNWGRSKYGTDLREKYSSSRHITMTGPIYDNPILNSLRCNARVYIHGHSAGGTNPSLVEAMSLGLAVIAYDVDYNRETTEGKAFYFKTPEQLQRLLTSTTDEDYALNAAAMKEIADRRYRWQIIRDKYEDLIRRAGK